MHRFYLYIRVPQILGKEIYKTAQINVKLSLLLHAFIMQRFVMWSTSFLFMHECMYNLASRAKRLVSIRIVVHNSLTMHDEIKHRVFGQFRISSL